MRATEGATRTKPSQLAPREIRGWSAPGWSGLGLVGGDSRTKHGHFGQGMRASARPRVASGGAAAPEADRQRVAVELEHPHLLCAGSRLIPGHINLGDPPVTLDLVDAAVCQRRGDLAGFRVSASPATRPKAVAAHDHLVGQRLDGGAVVRKDDCAARFGLPERGSRLASDRLELAGHRGAREKRPHGIWHKGHRPTPSGALYWHARDAALFASSHACVVLIRGTGVVFESAVASQDRSWVS